MKSSFKKFIKIILIVISSIIILLGTLAFLILKEFQKEFSQKVGEEVKLVEMIKAVSTFNFDSNEENKLKQNLKTKRVKEISVYYDPKQKGILPLTKETLEQAEQLTKKYLGDYQNRPVDLIYTDSKRLQKISPLKDISGYYSDFEKVMVVGLNVADIGQILKKNETSLYHFQKSILHEYTHYAMYRAFDEMGTKTTINEFPVWFIEGIAEYIGEDEENLDYHSFEIKFIKLKKLNTEEEWQSARLPNGEERVNPYLQGYFTVAYLINTYGPNIISTLLYETFNTQDFYQTLQSLTGKNIEELERDIIQYYH
jgi:hypothetical protein